MSTAIEGYSFGAESVPRSPVSFEDLEKIKATLLWTEDDDRALRQAGEVLDDKVEEILDTWYDFVGSNPHLAWEFSGSDGEPDSRYLQQARSRFEQWIRDTCNRPFDQNWLDYQHEVSLRHTPAKKNATDQVDSQAKYVPLRYLIAFIVPLSTTVRPFLERDGHPPEQVDAMYHAWLKAVTLTASMWAEQYSQYW